MFKWINRPYTEVSLSQKGKKIGASIFNEFAPGLVTSRDAWCYNSSKDTLSKSINRMVDFYGQEAIRLKDVSGSRDISTFVGNDPKKISWSRGLRDHLAKSRILAFDDANIMVASFRPFFKQQLYLDKGIVESIGKIPKFFPTNGAKHRTLAVTGRGARSGFSVILIDLIPNYHTLDTAQYYPLKIYQPATAEDSLFAEAKGVLTEQDGISDEGLEHFQEAYKDEQISKEDLFYYIYGLLHSPEYRSRFKNNLSKELPRIPAVNKVSDFWTFSKAGRKLGDLHVDYETVEPYPVVIKEGDLRLANITDPEAYYRVKKMKYGGKGKGKDKTTVHYNPQITMTQIPLEAYDYVVNGKPALDWVMERQCVKTDKASGIVNDANRYAIETVGNPAYPLELFQRVITVSLETMKIVNNLPALDID